MTLVEKLRQITEALEWNFHYGRRDFNNLVEIDSDNEEVIHFILDPVTRSPKYSNTGGYLNYSIYSGYFMILTKSDFDQVYDNQKEINSTDGKWITNIEPKIRNHFASLEHSIICDEDLQIVSFNITDIINVFDENMDGILVNYTLRQND